MQSTKSIEHIGIVQSVDNEITKVNILVQSACSSCHAKSMCSVGDSEEKIIDIINTKETYNIGEKVNVIMEQSLGYKALFLGYVLPFLIVLITLIILSAITNNEVLAGIISITILVPYYLILLFNKDKLRKTFSFSLKKIE
ncbi:MAG: SoxR reducing system RseC family protein [Bacteroidales bacterium]|nr:SoxR reducing system RseC family protein [Bacteroidales bacterium]